MSLSFIQYRCWDGNSLKTVWRWSGVATKTGDTCVGGGLEGRGWKEPKMTSKWVVERTGLWVEMTCYTGVGGGNILRKMRRRLRTTSGTKKSEELRVANDVE